jgi:hypothetical protein
MRADYTSSPIFTIVYCFCCSHFSATFIRAIVFTEVKVPPRIGWDGVVGQILDSATDAEQVHHILEVCWKCMYTS